MTGYVGRGTSNYPLMGNVFFQESYENFIGGQVGRLSLSPYSMDEASICWGYNYLTKL